MKTFSSNNELNSLLDGQDMDLDSLNYPKSSKIYQPLIKLIKEEYDNNKEIIISIILPVFNEENTIRGLLERLPRHDAIEIIVINDHSIDNSLKEIEKADVNGNRLKIINHDKNKGYGGAILTGINNSQGKVIVSIDSDGQHRPEDLYNLVKPIYVNEVDFTIGSRYLGRYFYDLPVATRLGEAIIEKCIQIFFGQKIMNNQNGYRAFSRRIVHIFNGVKYGGYAFATELILKATIFGYKIKECPIQLHDREHGASKIVLHKLAMNLFSCLLRYYFMKIKLHLFKNKTSNSEGISNKLFDHLIY